MNFDDYDLQFTENAYYSGTILNQFSFFSPENMRSF